MIRDFSSDDLLDLIAVDILYFAGFGVVEPTRGGFGIWQASGNTYVTWNTFSGFHDIELTGLTATRSAKYAGTRTTIWRM